jgi:PTH1 family peptidyl-tRNA hydrolase
VVGLGNPGETYVRTRHNLGFRAVERFAAARGARLEPGDCASELGALGPVLLALPQTYMNRSGYAVRCLAESRGLTPADVLVLYDDVSLPLGRLRARAAGGPGGHRGMESVIENLRDERISRVRMGIAPASGFEDGADLTSFVLSPFAAAEEEAVDAMLGRAVEAISTWIESGVEAVMNRFNADPEIPG